MSEIIHVASKDVAALEIYAGVRELGREACVKMLRMIRALKLFAVVILVALTPLRAVAGVTIGFCGSGHQGMAVSAHASHGEHAQHAHGAPAKPVESSCNICAEHCSSAAFAIPEQPVMDASVGGLDRTVLAEHGSALHVPDQLDRPPLA